jgi:hypothetical protein
VLYSIGATWNPLMSRYNRQVERGLSGIKGLNFAYRLNSWGPKTGPAMLPANTFSGAYVPTGLASPLTWIEGVFGVEAPADIVVDASNNLAQANTSLNNDATTIQTLLNQASGYSSVTGADVQAKAQASMAEAAGLQSNLATLQTAAQNLATQVSTLTGTTDKVAAQALKDAVASLVTQVSTFESGINQLGKDVSALVSYAQNGPGAVQTLENAAVSSVSTLTWLVGGGLLVYFLAPTFLPRMMGGIRKARSS